MSSRNADRRWASPSQPPSRKEKLSNSVIQPRKATVPRGLQARQEKKPWRPPVRWASRKLVDFLYTTGKMGGRRKIDPLWNGGPMSSTPSSPERRDEVEDLAQAIREAIDDEISELAANLASTDDAHIFGDNEFKIRALAHRIAAKAIQQRLAQKKTDTEAPA